jgi:N-acetylglutamate synthase/N-acetylornithine aminotransferase
MSQSDAIKSFLKNVYNTVGDDALIDIRHDIEDFHWFLENRVNSKNIQMKMRVLEKDIDQLIVNVFNANATIGQTFILFEEAKCLPESERGSIIVAPLPYFCI